MSVQIVCLIRKSESSCALLGLLSSQWLHCQVDFSLLFSCLLQQLLFLQLRKYLKSDRYCGWLARLHLVTLSIIIETDSSIWKRKKTHICLLNPLPTNSHVIFLSCFPVFCPSPLAHLASLYEVKIVAETTVKFNQTFLTAVRQYVILS